MLFAPPLMAVLACQTCEIDPPEPHRAAVVAQCVEDLRAGQKLKDDRWTDCWYSASELIATSPEEEPRVWALVDAIPAARWERGHLVGKILDSRLVRALATLPPVATDARSEAARSRPGAVELRAARAEYERLQRLGDEILKAPPGTEIAVQEHEAEFYALIMDYLRRDLPASELLARLARFHWGGWCGTGSEGFIHAQASAAELALVETRELERAAAVSLRRLGRTILLSENRDDAPRVFAAAGLDWEAIYAGAMLGGQRGGTEGLAERGAARSAHWLLAAAEMPASPSNPSTRLMENSGYIAALSGFVSPAGTSCAEDADTHVIMHFGGGPQRASDAPVVPAGLQLEILSALAKGVRPDAGLAEADNVSEALARLCRPESREAFTAMARSPYGVVRQRGVRALRALGEPVADGAAPTSVVFLVLVDGKPAADLDVSWQTMIGNGSIETSHKTDAKGRLVVDRDPFLDRRHPIREVAISAGSEASVDVPTFKRILPVPKNLDEDTTVSIATQPLTVHCEAAPKGAQVQLWVEHFLLPYNMAFAGPSMTWPRLQRDLKYSVVLTADKWRRQSPGIRLADGPALFDCKDALRDHRDPAEVAAE